MKTLKILIILSLAAWILAAGFFWGFQFSQRTSNQTAAVATRYHYSPLTKQAYFDAFFAAQQNCDHNYQHAIKGLIVNHHLLAGQFIAQGLCALATDQNLTIVLLSPNHFNHGGSAIVAADDWYTPYGVLPTNKNLIQALVADGALAIDEQPFDFDHGIYNITPFIKKVLPQASLVPILIKDSLSAKQKDLLISALEKHLPDKAVVIASLDFSHYLNSDQADQADSQTLPIISNLAIEKIPELNPNNQPDNVDSKPGLEILLRLMLWRQAQDFHLLAHSNSAELINDPGLTETTSYIVGYFSTN